MPTLTGFTRPSDPINAADMGNGISTAIGKTVTCVITPTDVQVTGSTISGADTTNIQTAMTAYFYAYLQYAAPISDNPTMSGTQHGRGVTEAVAYQGDLNAYNLAVANAGTTKTANRTYINGTSQNGSPVTGDIVEWIVTGTTSGGNITFYVTSNSLTGGTAICSTLFADSISTNFIDSSGVYAQGSPTVTSNKTVVIPFTKQGFNGVTLLSTNLLGSVAMNAIPDGVTVKTRIVGIAA